MLSVNHFEGVRLAYIKWLKADNELIEDAITGRKLNIVDQAQNIELVTGVGSTAGDDRDRETNERVAGVSSAALLQLSSSRSRPARHRDASQTRSFPLPACLRVGSQLWLY